MALNLARNSRVFFTTNVDSAGKINTGSFSATNLYELQVLDGFTFSQNTTQDTVTLSEAGGNPVRGQRSFNTSLAPADFSMSTYIRPFNATSSITAEESVLWNALLDKDAISTANTITVGGTVSGVTYAFASGKGTVTIAGTSMTYVGVAVNDIVVISGLSGGAAGDPQILNAAAKITGLSASSITLELVAPKAKGAAITAITVGTVKLYKSAWAPVASTWSYVSTGGSDLNQLQTFGMIFAVDNVVYTLDNCAMTQVSIDFGLDGIATAAWTGQGTQLNESSIALATLTAAATAKQTAAPFITNKLSTATLTLKNDIGTGANKAAADTAYAVALTGGNITINNNINYITPANLATVNVAQTYYTGTRAITGTLNAYLKTGTGVGGTGQLLKDMLANITAASAIEPMFSLTLSIGGSSNATRVDLDLQAVNLAVPTVDVQQVISTAINFTAQGYVPSATANGNTFAVDVPSDLAVRYYAA
jgi:hypothetical protein